MVWLTGWKYRKKITIQGATGAGTNYQVLLKVGESAGATGANFHVEGNSDIFPSGRNQSGDLRFTASDGLTLLDFWVDRVTGTAPNRIAECWVEVLADLGTNQDIFCYYGNPNATNVSNIANTFVWGDDFSTNRSAQYTFSGATWDTVNKKVRLSAPANTSAFLSPTGLTILNCKIRAEASFVSSNGDYWFVIRARSNNQSIVEPNFSLIYQLGGRAGQAVNGHVIYKYVSGVWTLLANGTNFPDATGLITFEATLLNSSLSSRILDTADETITATDTSITTAGYLGLLTYGCVWDVFLFYVRKFVSPEPTFLSAGPQETISELLFSIFFPSSLKSTEKVGNILNVPFPISRDIKEKIPTSKSINFPSSSNTVLGKIVQGIVRRIFSPKGGGIIKNR